MNDVVSNICQMLTDRAIKKAQKSLARWVPLPLEILAWPTENTQKLNGLDSGLIAPNILHYKILTGWAWTLNLVVLWNFGPGSG